MQGAEISDIERDWSSVLPRVLRACRWQGCTHEARPSRITVHESKCAFRIQRAPTSLTRSSFWRDDTLHACYRTLAPPPQLDKSRNERIGIRQSNPENLNVQLQKARKIEQFRAVPKK